jgi:DNA polymerase-3 subunit delta'
VFSSVIGHRRLIHLLSRSIRRDSLPPSLLFAGPEGVGKRLTALATAQALNCLNPVMAEGAAGTGASEPERARQAGRHEPEGRQAGPHEREGRKAAPHEREGRKAEALEIDACATCSTCSRIARGIHPDVLLVEPGDTSTIKIEAVRDIVDRAGFRPFEGRRRVVIIDDADALVVQAQNALLKTLEEPPSASVFILVTSKPDLLLPTVLSRCPKLLFRPLGPGEVAQALIRQGRSEAEAHAIAATADGSIGRALSVSGGELVEVRDVALRVLVDAAAHDDPRRRIETARELHPKPGGSGTADREALGVQLRAMASLIRDAELLSADPNSAALANSDVRAALARLAAYRGRRGVRAFEVIDEGLGALGRNAGAKVVADWVVLNL